MFVDDKSANRLSLQMMLRSDMIRQRARELGLSMAEVARLSGVSERAFNHYVSGRSEPGLATLVRIAETLCCTPNDLLGIGTTIEIGTEEARLRRSITDLCTRLDQQALNLVLTLVVSVKDWREHYSNRSLGKAP